VGNTSLGFLDLHTHVLPGVDDGPATTGDALAVLHRLGAIGFDTVCATPHQKADQFLPSAEAIEQALGELRAAVSGASEPAPGLVLGAENMWDSCFYERFQAGTIPCYENSRTFLLELPLLELPAGLPDHIFRLRASGMLPVLAHPERYRALSATPELGAELAQSCALVVNLTALGGDEGRRRAKLARTMVRDGVAHAATSDTHSLEDVAAAAEGISWIRKKMGDRAVARLLDENPRRILAGAHPEE